jgi:ribose transport system ATP-binding protein
MKTQSYPQHALEMPNAVSMLEVDGVFKAFPGTQALQNVSLKVQSGEVLALMGLNGAGKSTLLKILAGAYRADQGNIRINGIKTQINSPLEARAAGINLIYQEPNLVSSLTVAENIFMGCELKRGLLIDSKTMNIQSEMMLERLCAQFSSNTVIHELCLAERQLVEIARALMFKGRILLMDEPTAALSLIETAALFEVIAQLRSEGMAIVYTSHRINEVYALADRVSVLRNGENVGVLEPDEIYPDRIVEMMIGQKPEEFQRIPLPKLELPAVLELRNLSDGDKVNATNLQVRAGEILGLAGILGAGQSELFKLIFGANHKTSGSVLIDGQPRAINSPSDAIGCGIGYVPSNNQEQGIFLEMNARDNVVLSILKKHTRLGILNHKTLDQAFVNATQNIPLAHQNQTRAQNFSSGTQQKLLIARWLALKPRVLLLDEPTRGVDIEAKFEIYRILAELAETGIGIVLISSELAELEYLCDRVIVMRKGEIVGELDPSKGEAITQAQIMSLATGVRSTTDMA